MVVFKYSHIRAEGYIKLLQDYAGGEQSPNVEFQSDAKTIDFP